MAHGGCAYFDATDNNTGIVAMVIFFLFAYYNSSGPLAWLYAAETLIDAALGTAITILYLTAFVLSVVSPILMQDDMMGPTAVFIVFSGFSLAGALYSGIYIRDTRGLSDKEKKEVYLTKEQKLKLHLREVKTD